jgi:hypothetical protein
MHASPLTKISLLVPKAESEKTQIGREMVRRKNQAVRAQQKAENGETLIVSEIERRTKIARLFFSSPRSQAKRVSVLVQRRSTNRKKGFSPARTLGSRAAIYM